MSDYATALDTVVSREDWERMAKHAGVSAAELKAKLVPALEGVFGRGAPETTAVSNAPGVKLTAVEQEGDCRSQSFEVDLFSIVGVGGKLTLCGTNSHNWSAKLTTCLIVAGSSVVCQSYKFDPHDLSVCLNPNAAAAKAKLCYKLRFRHGKICMSVKGRACVWSFGWRCGSFSKALFCIGLP
ncbi:MAG TPA: hypothetical protein VHB01_06520 [Nitrosospira sp.]|nr:hypothetical protein [Nitrosospira sp.]